MKILDRLIWIELIGPFLTGMFMFLALVFAAGTLFQAADWLVQGVPVMLVLRLVALSLPSVITQTFPMAMLLAGLLGFGNLSTNRETVALFAAGTHFLRMSRPVFIMGAIVSVAAFLWNDYVVPPASTAFYDLRGEALKHKLKSDKPLYFPKERQDGKGLEEYISIQGGYDAHERILKHVAIIVFSSKPGREGQPEGLLYCDWAKPKGTTGLDWIYHDGYFVPYIENQRTGKVDQMFPIYFKQTSSSPRIPSLDKSFEDVLKAEVTDTSRKSFRELRKEIQRDKKEGYDARGKEVDLYGKIALPLASLIFGIVGAALGVSTRRGASKTVGFGLAIFIVFLYWVFFHSMFVIGKSGGLPPILASFMADIVGAAVGVVLALRASQ